jgi:LEA14-like dessication related protein
LKKATIVIVVLLLIFSLPLSYLGLLYVSATSAKYSISGISFSNIPDLMEVLITRQLDIELYFDIEGHGIVSIPVKSISGQIYFEDIYMGSIESNEPFRIPVSGVTTAHLNFHLDLSSISLSDLQQVINSIISHNGEVKTGFDGYVEPIILFFPITIPLSINTYSLTYSNTPIVSNLYWNSDSVALGESATFFITVENVFRGSSINGVLDIFVREDVAFGSDVNAEEYHFQVQLSPESSQTFSDSFSPYKEDSTRGFFLKAQWGNTVLTEQQNSYPPRLSIISGSLNLVSVYWTVSGTTSNNCQLGDEVIAHVVIRATNAASTDTITVRIRKDIALWVDQDFEVASFDILLEKDESAEYTVPFTPDQVSGGSLRGYFVEIEGGLSWTMPDTYPPRLTVIEQQTPTGTPSLQNVWWTINNQIVTEALQGQTVIAHIQIKAISGRVQGLITVHIRRDIVLLPDEDHTIQSFNIDLEEGQPIDLTVTFTAEQQTGLSFRGYFVQVDLNTWGSTWTMDSLYPPRLKVN